MSATIQAPMHASGVSPYGPEAAQVAPASMQPCPLDAAVVGRVPYTLHFIGVTAMNKLRIGPSPSPSTRNDEERRSRIAEFWSRLRVCEDLGATSWEVLEPIELEVTDCLSRDPPDIARAESHTAKAFLLI
jgi:hypothetical protein